MSSAAPNVGFGLRRSTRNEPPRIVPSSSGRSGTRPGFGGGVQPVVGGRGAAREGDARGAYGGGVAGPPSRSLPLRVVSHCPSPRPLSRGVPVIPHHAIIVSHSTTLVPKQ